MSDIFPQLRFLDRSLFFIGENSFARTLCIQGGQVFGSAQKMGCFYRHPVSKPILAEYYRAKIVQYHNIIVPIPRYKGAGL